MRFMKLHSILNQNIYGQAFWSFLITFKLLDYLKAPLDLMSVTKELSFCHKLLFSNHYIFEPDAAVELWYFKLWIKLDQIIIVWNIEG